TFYVDVQPAFVELGHIVVGRAALEIAVRDGGDDGPRPRQRIPGLQIDAVLAARLGRVGHRIVHMHVGAVRDQLLDDVNDTRVAYVRTIFLEREAEDVDVGTLDRRTRLDQLLDRLLGDELAHAVVDAPAGENDLGMVAELVGHVRQIVGIDADTMAADQARPKGQEVPFGSGRLEHFERIDAYLVEDQRQLVHQRDVEIPLRVLDDLGRFGDLDRARAVDAGRDDAAIDGGNAFQRLRRVAADQLDDARQRMLLVPRIDALGRIPDEKIALPHHAGSLGYHRHANVLGCAGVHGRLEHDGGAALEIPADGFAGREQRTEVGLVRIVDRRRHGDDDKVGATQSRRVGRAAQAGGCGQLGGTYFAGRVDAFAVRRHLGRG